MKNTDEPTVITDPEAKRWYDFGFRFALNYIYASMLKSGDYSIDPQAFRAFLDDILEVGVEDDFFERYPFKEGRYPTGQCPADIPNACIPCADRSIVPIDKLSE